MKDQEICQKIGDSLVNLTNENWDHLTLRVEFGEGVITAKGFYFDNESKKPIKINHDLIKLFKDLRSVYPENSKFKAANFLLNRNGKFDLKLEY